MSTIREILVEQAFEPHRYPFENLRATNAQNVLSGLTIMGGHSLVTEDEWKSHLDRRQLSKGRRAAIEKFAEESRPYGWDIQIDTISPYVVFRCNCCGKRKAVSIRFKFKKGKAYTNLPIYCWDCIHDNPTCTHP